jgi:hypothetical protein
MLLEDSGSSRNHDTLSDIVWKWAFNNIGQAKDTSYRVCQ